MSVKDWLKFILLGLVWGSSFLWIKIAVSEVGPFTLVAFRVLFAALGILVVVLASRPAVQLTRRAWRAFLVMGLINVVIPFILISWSEQHIPSSLAAILNSTVPLFTILISPIFLAEERITLPRIVGLAAGFTGVIILMSGGLTSGNQADSLLPVGIVTMLLAACSYAAAAVFGRRSAPGLPTDVYSLGQMGVATAIMWIAAPIVEAPFQLPRLPLTWVALLWLGLLGSSLGTLLFFSLLRSVGPTRTTLVTYVFPLVGVILGIVFLGEHIDWRIGVGGALIISGIAIVNARLPWSKSIRSIPFSKRDPEKPE